MLASAPAWMYVLTPPITPSVVESLVYLGHCHGLFPCRFTSVDAREQKISHSTATFLAVSGSQ
jgi:hypothetical protein